jgi:addiction module HigA family antidote
MPKSPKSPVDVLNALMNEYNLTPTSLARASGLSQPTVRLIARGENKISALAALHLAKYFGATAEYWLTLQTKYDLSEAAKDTQLMREVAAIAKATKVPLAKKPVVKKAAPKKRVSKAAPRAEKPAAAKSPKSTARKSPKNAASPAPKKRGRKPRAASPALPAEEKPFVPHVVLIKKKDKPAADF